MNSSKSIPGLSRRLQWLLLIAISGYEYVIYQHFVWHVPLRPERVVELQPGQTPMGFLPEGVLAISSSQPERPGPSLPQYSGPVEIRTNPTGALLENYQLQPVEQRDGRSSPEVTWMPVIATVEGFYGVLRQHPGGGIEWSRQDADVIFRDNSMRKIPNRARWKLDAEGHLDCSTDQPAVTASRESALGPSSEVRVRHPATAMVGDRFAFFPNLHEHISGTPWLVHIAKNYLLRLGVLGSSATYQNFRALYDLERREFVGLVSTSGHDLFVDPQGRGFVIRRYPIVLRGPSQLEFYGAPPGRDWPWLLWRGLGPPAVIAALVLVRWAVVRLRRRGFAVKAGSDDFAEVVV